MERKRITIGLVGAGYIAKWHAEAIAMLPELRLAAVCDPNRAAAEAVAQGAGAQVYGDLAELLARQDIDAVHILTPPPLHAAQSIAAIKAGKHVLCEKPFALSLSEAEEMRRAAEEAGRLLAVNHNFLGLPAYERLKAQIKAGALGRIDRAEFRWHYPLSPIRSGPFGLWMLRSPANLLQELGPHLFSFLHDLLGPMEEVSLHLGKEITLPSGVTLPQSWRVLGHAGGAEVTLSLSLVEGIEDRSLSLRGVTGAAHLDFASDSLILERSNSADLVMNPLLRQMSLGGQHLCEGVRNAVRQGLSLNRKQPYALGFMGMFRAFYRSIAEGAPLDPRFAAGSAVAVTGMIDAVLRQLPPSSLLPAPKATIAVAAQAQGADALVIGGTGFIGRALVRALVARGYRTRVLSRGRANPFADLGDRVEIVAARMTDEEALVAAMEGVATVYHLARAEEATWQAYLEKDVAVTETIARAALRAKVERFVYTGTIASYDASDPRREISEVTDFGPMEARNLYARSKALCEERLSRMHREQGLPLVVARPGIVLGEGGPLQHWGIGRWHGAGAVRIWGHGRNLLPFVLVEDVAEALVQAGLFGDGRGKPEITGESFNLIGPPLMSARDYFAAIHRLTGARISVASGNLRLLYLADQVKYRMKRHILRKKGLCPPSKADWLSRGHFSPFTNAKAREKLDWLPEGDAARFAERAIAHQRFFGF